ncbi:MAG: acyl-CoA thioesterase [Lacisediminihabitans sp.]
MLLRTILTLLLARRKPPLHIHEVARMPMRVLPTDLDVLNHVNNGVYFSLMDLGRMELLIRAGAWERVRRLGYYPVVASETITFRKSLRPWQRYTLETCIAGYDAKAVYVEQRFAVDGEIYVQAFLRARFLKKTGGVVSLPELAALLEIDVSELTLPEWIDRWASDVALPSTRTEAPSDWS